MPVGQFDPNEVPPPTLQGLEHGVGRRAHVAPPPSVRRPRRIAPLLGQRPEGNLDQPDFDLRQRHRHHEDRDAQAKGQSSRDEGQSRSRGPPAQEGRSDQAGRGQALGGLGSRQLVVNTLGTPRPTWRVCREWCPRH